MYKREVPKLNKANFTVWKSWMKLHKSRIGNFVLELMENGYIEPTPSPLTLDQLKDRHEHNVTMMELGVACTDVKFNDIKDCDTTQKMWDKLNLIYSGDANVKRAKAESLRGRFDDMKMKEGENIVQYTNRLKEVVHAIRAFGGNIDDETVIKKILRTLLPVYAIRISVIHETRATSNLTLDTLIGKLTTFELNNFNNSVVPSIESTFMSSLKIGKSSSKNDKYNNSDSNTNDELDELEALMARRLPKGKGRYRGKLPLACFNCKEVGHIAARCLNKKDDDRSKDRSKGSYGRRVNRGYRHNNRDNQDNHDKGIKVCYIAKEFESKSDTDDVVEVVFVAMKDDLEEEEKYEKTTLISKVSRNDTWIIDSGCTHHMIGDIEKFDLTDEYDGGFVRMGNDAPCMVRGKGSLMINKM